MELESPLEVSSNKIPMMVVPALELEGASVFVLRYWIEPTGLQLAL